MAVLNFYKVTTLPTTLVPDSLYFVESGTYSETYVTNNAGVARSVGNSDMINALIAEALGQFEAGGVVIVPDIAARDALQPTVNTLVLVIDATADPTVSEGAALYAYNVSTQEYIKVAEYESMDVTVQWNDIQGRPSSTPAQIDAAVAASHTHANKATLDKITEVSGLPKWDGGVWPVEWTTSNW